MAKYGLSLRCKCGIVIFADYSRKPSQEEIDKFQCPKCRDVASSLEEVDDELSLQSIESYDTLCNLEGSEKQISWANSIRLQKLLELGNRISTWYDLIQKLPKSESEKAKLAMKRRSQAIDCIYDLKRNQKSAAWWIDHKDSLPTEILKELLPER